MNAIKEAAKNTINTIRRAQYEDVIEAVKGMADAETVRAAIIEMYCEEYHCKSLPADSMARINHALGFINELPQKESAPFDPNW